MCQKAELEFSVFIIHQLAENWNKKPSEVYAILNKTKILDDYIIKHYDVLHTMGSMALVEDITDFVHEKGVAV
ncbi:MAG: DUF3791 domain-containing protein [Treponemataceae bacterium]|nr:DUF3791 domain-containing protein [Treponemataceae bacterium]